MAVEAVSEAMLFVTHRDSGVLLRAVEDANRRVLQASQDDASLEGMGTTLVVALEMDDGISIASVGDSRAYLLDGDGFRAITEDQTWVNEVGRPLGLAEEVLRNHPMRHVLTMAIGASSPLAVHYYPVPLSPGAVVLMCSDGLHGVVDDAHIEEILRQAGDSVPLMESCQRLIDAAKEAGGPDNVTTVLLRKPV